MHFCDNSGNIIQLECKHFSTPSIPIPYTTLCCRLKDAASVSPYITIFTDPVTSVIDMPCLSCSGQKMIHMMKRCLGTLKGFGLETRSNRCPLLVEKEYSQIVNQFFGGLLSSAGLLATRCSKKAKYIVKGHWGVIGSVNMFHTILL